MARGSLCSIVALRKVKLTGLMKDCSLTLALERQESDHGGDSLLVLAKGCCLEQLLGMSIDKLQEHLTKYQVNEGAIMRALSLKLIGQCALVSTDQYPCNDDKYGTAINDSVYLLTDIKLLVNDCATILSFPPFCYHFQTPRHVTLHGKRNAHWHSITGSFCEESFNTSIPKMHQSYCNESYQLLSWNSTIYDSKESTQYSDGVCQTTATGPTADVRWTYDVISASNIQNIIKSAPNNRVTHASDVVQTSAVGGNVIQTRTVALGKDAIQTSAMTPGHDGILTNSKALTNDVAQRNAVILDLSSKPTSAEFNSSQENITTSLLCNDTDCIQHATLCAAQYPTVCAYTTQCPDTCTNSTQCGTVPINKDSYFSLEYSWQHWCDVNDPVVTPAKTNSCSDSKLLPRVIFPSSSLVSSSSPSFQDSLPTEFVPHSTVSPCVIDNARDRSLHGTYSPCYYFENKLVSQGALEVVMTPRNVSCHATPLTSSSLSLIGNTPAPDKFTENSPTNNAPSTKHNLSTVSEYTRNTPELFDDPHIHCSDSPELFPIATTPCMHKYKCPPKCLLSSHNKCTPDIL